LVWGSEGKRSGIICYGKSRQFPSFNSNLLAGQFQWKIHPNIHQNPPIIHRQFWMKNDYFLEFILIGSRRSNFEPWKSH
jgi:hypothetical protein